MEPNRRSSSVHSSDDKPPIPRSTVVLTSIAGTACVIVLILVFADAVFSQRSGPWAGVVGAVGAVAGGALAVSEALAGAGRRWGFLALGVVIFFAIPISGAILFLTGQDRPTIELASSVVAAGDEVTVNGENFSPGETVEFRLNESGALEERQARDDGGFNADVLIPQDGTSGVLSAVGRSGSHAEAPIEVVPQRAILYWSNLDDDYDIYALDPREDAEPIPVMDKATDDRYPAWSPDGTRIAFARYEGNDWDIWLMNADGSEPEALTDDPQWERFPVWSPDGLSIAFSRGEGSATDLFVMPAAGGDALQLTHQSGEERPGSWSVADEIAIWVRYADDGDIFTVRPDGSGLEPMEAINTTTVERDPRWAPDGQRVTFVSDRDGQRDIWLYDTETDDLTRLTRDTHSEGTPVWSPDGHSIAFSRGEGDAINIWTMDEHGKQEVGLTIEFEEAHYLDPSWGPWSLP